MKSFEKQLITKKFGPWALIAGASDGLGESFARFLAKQGMNLVLIARRKEKLNTLATNLEEKYMISQLWKN